METKPINAENDQLPVLALASCSAPVDRPHTRAINFLMSDGRKTHMNADQREVVKLLKERGTLTTVEAVKIFGRHIYTNAEKHIGTRLARMVKRGIIVRVKPGVFSLPNR
jgi:uncharacterized membrane protein